MDIKLPFILFIFMTIILLSVAILEGMFVKKKLKSNEKMVATQENGENNFNLVRRRRN